MSGLIGKKIGMTSIYDVNGRNIPCTVIEAGPCVVTQVRLKEIDGYEAIQLAFDEKKEKHTTKAEMGHFAKAGITPKKVVAEFTRFEVDHQKVFGDVLQVDIFIEGEFIDVVGVSKGKGFQGVVKRHGFGGGPRSHGQKHSEREPGSIGGGLRNKVPKKMREQRNGQFRNPPAFCEGMGEPLFKITIEKNEHDFFIDEKGQKWVKAK